MLIARRPREVDGHAVDRGHEIAEAGQIEHHEVVDLDVEVLLDGLHQPLRSAERHRRVDLALLGGTGDRHPQVTRERQQRGAIALRIDAQHHDRVGVERLAATTKHRVARRQPRAVIDTDQQDVLRFARRGLLVEHAPEGQARHIAHLTLDVRQPGRGREAQHHEHRHTCDERALGPGAAGPGHGPPSYQRPVGRLGRPRLAPCRPTGRVSGPAVRARERSRDAGSRSCPRRSRAPWRRGSGATPTSRP